MDPDPAASELSVMAVEYVEKKAAQEARHTAP
jgi:hypothetical protein